MKDQLLEHRERLFLQVIDEQDKQVAKWGVQDHTPFEWMTFLTEEVGELAQAISEVEWRNGTVAEVSKEAIQVATLALKIAEMYQWTHKDDYPRPDEDGAL